jgi:hypothetical protein
MTQRRTFTAEFKTQVVRDLIRGTPSAAELSLSAAPTQPSIALPLEDGISRTGLIGL